MDNIYKLQKEIILAIEKIADSRIKKTDINKTVRGTVIEILGNDKYKVLINEKQYIVKSHFTHNINEIVRIVVCNGNMNELFVLY